MNRKDSDWEKELTETPLGWGGFSKKSMREIKERVEQLDKKKRYPRPLAACLLILALLASGWLLNDPINGWVRNQEASNQAIPDTWDEEDLELSVQYWDTNSFMSDIGQPFVIRHPSVHFEVAENSDIRDITAYIKWIEDNKPDVLQVPLAFVEDLANAGIIKPLDDWITKSNYALQDFHQPVIRTLREAGAGKLYGLAPYFETSALYYNKTLFDKFGIATPQSHLSWKEVMQLASRFTGTDTDGKPIYGLTTDRYTTPFRLLLKIGETEGLRILSSDQLQPTLNTAAWRNVWETILGGYKEGFISNENRASTKGNVLMSDLYKADPFLSGRAALAYRTSSYQWDIGQAMESIGFNDEWGVVTQPINPNQPDLASDFDISTVYAVNTESSHQEAAWSLIQYIVSPEKAKRDAQNGYAPFSSRSLSSENASIDNADIFYKLEVDSTAILNKAELNQLPEYSSFYQGLTEAGNQALESVIKGSSSLEDAMEQLQLQAVQLSALMNSISSQAEESPLNE
ncbi:ABC transporter substrate-binding protein [Cohnella sp.]|uniref:ABC transporter substrate-binding protein n=1 Tax=Cohnella sp. TaxID=1883426 RepID=UPI003569AB01